MSRRIANRWAKVEHLADLTEKVMDGLERRLAVLESRLLARDARHLLLARFRSLRADGVRALSPALLERIRTEVAARAVAMDDERRTGLPDALAALREIDADALWAETAQPLAFA